jgi:hypothetical protein
MKSPLRRPTKEQAMKKVSVSIDGGKPVEMYVIPIDLGSTECESDGRPTSRSSTDKYREGWDRIFAQKPNNANN